VPPFSVSGRRAEKKSACGGAESGGTLGGDGWKGWRRRTARAVRV